MVPKGIVENIKFRHYCVTLGSRSLEWARELWTMCARDPLFYMATFVWAYSPKDFPANPVRPFIPHPQQEDVILGLIDAWNEGKGVVLYKSRDQGGTAVCCAAIEWAWHFQEALSFLLTSRIQPLVDKPGDTKTLFHRIDFCHRHQPRWLLPTGRHLDRDDPNRTLNHLLNADNGSVIDGEATTKDLTVGDKRTAILLDERARMKGNTEINKGISAATNCAINNSTMRGTTGSSGEFWRLLKRAQQGHFKLLTLFWPWHPSNGKGLYTSINEAGPTEPPKYRLEIIDKGYKFPEGYEFILDGDECEHLGYTYMHEGRRVKVRSPYFDDFEGKWGKVVADQELSGSERADGSAAISGDMLTRYARKFVMQPEMATFSYNILTGDEGKIALDRSGDLRLWCRLRAHDSRPPEGDYLITCDIARGTGGPESTPSVASVVDTLSMEKVARISRRKMRPDQFAMLVHALAKVFWNAEICHESNGPGVTFGKTLAETLLYRKIWWNYDIRKVGQRQIKVKKTGFPGMHTSADSKDQLVDNMVRMMALGEYQNHDADSIKECGELLIGEDGHVYHPGEECDDPGESGENHADIVMTDMIACQILHTKYPGGRKIRSADHEVTRKPAKIPKWSMAGRHEQDAKLEHTRRNRHSLWHQLGPSQSR